VMAVEDNSYIAVGKVVGVFGHQGWFKVLVYSGKIDRFKDIKVVYFQSETGMTGKVLSSSRYHGNSLLLKLKSIDEPESARLMIGEELFLPDSQQIELPANHFFVHDLVGMQVFDIEKGYVGDIADVLTGGASDILVIQSEEKEILIPAISEFIEEVDLERGRIKVRMWEEL